MSNELSPSGFISDLFMDEKKSESNPITGQKIIDSREVVLERLTSLMDDEMEQEDVKTDVLEMEKTETFSMADLVQLGLMGSGSKDRRIALGKKFHIGYGNGKQFLKKLNSYNISREDLVKAVEELDER